MMLTSYKKTTHFKSITKSRKFIGVLSSKQYWYIFVIDGMKRILPI
jgi:hypothetical protein